MGPCPTAWRRAQIFHPRRTPPALPTPPGLGAPPGFTALFSTCIKGAPGSSLLLSPFGLLVCRLMMNSSVQVITKEKSYLFVLLLLNSRQIKCCMMLRFLMRVFTRICFPLLCVYFFYAGRETPLINRFYKGLCILAANCQLQFFATWFVLQHCLLHCSLLIKVAEVRPARKTCAGCFCSFIHSVICYSSHPPEPSSTYASGSTSSFLGLQEESADF